MGFFGNLKGKLKQEVKDYYDQDKRIAKMKKQKKLVEERTKLEKAKRKFEKAKKKKPQYAFGGNFGFTENPFGDRKKKGGLL